MRVVGLVALGVVVLVLGGVERGGVPLASAGSGFGWGVGAEAVLPDNAALTNQTVSMYSVSCSSAGNCAAVGRYFDASGGSHGLLLTETNGVWGKGVEAVLPANAASPNLTASVRAVSCASAGNCTAVGYYDAVSPNYEITEAVLLTETNGTWATGVEATLPSDAMTGSQGNQWANLLSVSCASAGNCTAVGTYRLDDNLGTTTGLLLTQTGGVWSSGLEAPVPGNGTPADGAPVTSVSCTSAGNCVAVGSYDMGASLLTEAGGSWTAAEAQLPANATGTSAGLNSVSCPSAGNCTAVGAYSEGLLLLNETAGTWGTGVEGALPANASPNPIAGLFQVSCGSAGNCSAIGSYRDNGGFQVQRGLLLSETSGTWATGIEPTLPANHGTGTQAGSDLNSISCPAAGTCQVVGDYYDSSGDVQGLLLSETSGTWTAGTEASLPANGPANSFPHLSSVSCPTTAACSAVGAYGTSSGANVEGLLLQTPPPPVTLTVVRHGTGVGSVTSSPAGISCGATCAHLYAYGTSVQLNAKPALGSSFSGWTGSGCSGTGTCTVAMTQARSVTATFAARPPQTLKISKTGHGTVTSRPSGINCGSTCSHAYRYGTLVKLTAHPATGYVFAGWSGACTGVSAACSVSMTAPRGAKARFAVPKLLTVTKAGMGSGVVTSSPAGISCGASCKHAFAAGTVVTLTATASSGSTFTGWSGACSGTGTCVVTMSAAKTAQATFTTGHLYWVDQGAGTVNAISLGGGSVTTLASGQNLPCSVAVDGTHVYWANGGDGTIKEVPLGGGSVTTLASGQNHPTSVKVDGTHVYWINYAAPSNVATGTVNEVPLGGGSVTTLASGQDAAISLAVDSTHVYWVNQGNGAVNEVPLGGGSVTTLASDPAQPLSVAVNGTHVYWFDFSNGKVNEVPLGGGSVTTLATSFNSNSGSIAVDGMNVYWSGWAGGGTVSKVPLGGGSVTTLATGQSGPVSVTVDGTHVYWANFSDGTVREVPLGGGSVTTLATGQDTPTAVVVGP